MLCSAQHTFVQPVAGGTSRPAGDGDEAGAGGTSRSAGPGDSAGAGGTSRSAGSGDGAEASGTSRPAGSGEAASSATALPAPAFVQPATKTLEGLFKGLLTKEDR